MLDGRWCAGWILVAAVALGRIAGAEDDPDTEVARRLFKSGVELYTAQKYEPALGEFEKARLARPLPAFDYNIARCHDRLGHWADALASYERYAATATNSEDMRDAAERIAVLELRVQSAAQRAAADQHYRSAVGEYNAGRFAAAASEFLASYQAVADPAVLYHVADAFRLAGDDPSARRYYESFLHEVPGSSMRGAVEAHVAALAGAKVAAPTPVTTHSSAPPPPAKSSSPPLPPTAKTTPDATAASDRHAAITDVVKKHRDGFRACYDHFSATSPGHPLKVTLAFYLDPDGMFDRGQATVTGADAPTLAGCIVGAARALTWPGSPSGRFTRISYPFDFKPL